MKYFILKKFDFLKMKLPFILLMNHTFKRFFRFYASYIQRVRNIKDTYLVIEFSKFLI